MKHTNQDDSSRNPGAGTDQQKRTNKAQGDRNEGMAQQHTRGTKGNTGKQESDHSNWQKDKQGSKK